MEHPDPGRDQMNFLTCICQPTNEAQCSIRRGTALRMRSKGQSVVLDLSTPTSGASGRGGHSTEPSSLLSGSGFRRRADGPGPSGPPMPHPSPRIKLRPPTLMPTLPTGAAMNDMYMEARQAAIKLGQSRNACLARAAEAWRRGDGATAKRFSREANVLNERMTVETADAAANLVRQRRTQAQEAIRARGEWSSDPEDRSSKGKECAGGLGVVMGVAGANILGPASEALTTSERTEVLLDLHMLHANEASDVLEDFLMAVSTHERVGISFWLTKRNNLVAGTGEFPWSCLHRGR
jgi:hypothetical protein